MRKFTLTKLEIDWLLSIIETHKNISEQFQTVRQFKITTHKCDKLEMKLTEMSVQ